MSYSVMRPFKKKKTVLNSRIISFGPESASISKVYQDSRFRDSWTCNNRECVRTPFILMSTFGSYTGGNY